MKKILFICQGNVGRSQMAEAFYNTMAHDSLAISAGIADVADKYGGHPTPEIVTVMKEVGIDVSHSKIKKVTKQLFLSANRVVVLCAKDICPSFISKSKKTIYFKVADPAGMGLVATRKVRDSIKQVVDSLLKMNKNLIFVTGMHGDEPIPVFCLASLGIQQVLANPKALALGKRFVETDLNSSFGTNKKDYESRRAKQVLKVIPSDSFVVDLHTFSVNSEPFAIIVDLAMLSFAQTTGLKHVVYMKYNIKKGRALINKRKGISVEVGYHKDPSSLAVCKKVVENVKKGKKVECKVYEVFGVIDKAGEYKNFEKCKEGFIPVLAGERAYKFFGLKAKEITPELDL